MIIKTDWEKVSRDNLCPVCQKPDWCFIGDKFNLCNRIQSDKPAKGGGWYHKKSGEIFKRTIPSNIFVPKKNEQIDAYSIWNEWNKQNTAKSLILFAEKLGVDPMSLMMLGCAWAYPHSAWAFPMRDRAENVIGIRLRNEIGQKWAVKGSRSGLFIPTDMDYKENLFITEGVTDCAAALCLGFQAIGRPSCLGLEEMTRDFVASKKIKRCVVVADNDEPGIRGAEKLQEELNVSSCILILPTKDLREFFINKGTKKDIENIIKNLVWSKK